MKKYFLAGILLLGATCIQAQLLWKVSGNGLESPSYVMGTHHLVSFSILDEIEGLESAFNSVEQVYGEVEMDEMTSSETMMKMQMAMFMPQDTTLRTLYSEDEFEFINTFTTGKMGMDLNSVLSLKPTAIMNIVAIYLHQTHTDNHQSSQQLDSYFQNKAAEEGKKTGGLESVDFQINLLYNSPFARQAELLLCLLNDPEKSISQIKRLEEAYMKQDLESLLELIKEQEGTSCDYLPGELEAINDNRNRNWIGIMPDVMAKNPTFFAVGALHLPGENGILNLLKQSGYTIEPVK